MTKLLRVLAALLRHTGGTGVSLQELSRELDLPQSTAHRILQLCISHGMAMQTEEQRYAVGPSLLALGISAAEEWGLGDSSRRALKELATQVNEEAYLTMRVGDTGVFVDRSASPSPIRVIRPLLEQLPLHCGASRKVLLAYADEDFRDEYLSRPDLETYTDATIVDPDALRSELAKIREVGYATSFGERSLDIAGVAVPVFGPWGRVLASVAVLAPISALQGQQLEHAIVSVTAAANTITEGLRSRIATRTLTTTRKGLSK